MRALLSYTLGFALPAFVIGVLLYIDFNSDERRAILSDAGLGPRGMY